MNILLLSIVFCANIFSETEDEVELRTQALSEMTTGNPEQEDSFKWFNHILRRFTRRSSSLGYSTRYKDEAVVLAEAAVDRHDRIFLVRSRIHARL